MRKSICLLLAALQCGVLIACRQMPQTDASLSDTSQTTTSITQSSATIDSKDHSEQTTVKDTDVTTVTSHTTQVQQVVTRATTAKTSKRSTVAATTIQQPIRQDALFAQPLTVEQINAIPVANSSMSTDQLRQICLDYFRLQLTFPWSPDRSFEYTYNPSGGVTTRTSGKLYAGLPYVTNAFGNLYRTLRYYDSATGLLHVEGEDQDFADLIGNQCSVGSGWAWARVVNNTSFVSTITMTHAQGCLKLGPYTYDLSMREFKSTRTICRENGEQVMYQSYAMWQPADGMVRYSGGGHVQMVSSKPNVVIDPETGLIDGDNSTVRYMDQTSTSPRLIETPQNGWLLRQGNVDREISFKSLYTSSYVPFTFAEFIGEGEVEKGEVTVRGYTIPKNKINLSDLTSASLKSNYYISDVQLHFYDRLGKYVQTVWGEIEMDKSYYYASSSWWRLATDERVVQMSRMAGATVDVVVRLGNGEQISLYKGDFVI